MPKVKLNQNELAKRIAEREGLAEQVSIAQIKEVMKWTFVEMMEMAIEDGVPFSEIIALMEKTHAKYAEYPGQEF